MTHVTDAHKKELSKIRACDVVRVAMNERIHCVALDPTGDSNPIIPSGMVTGHVRTVLEPIFDLCLNPENGGLSGAITNATAFFGRDNDFVKRGGSGNFDHLRHGEWQAVEGSYEACRAKIDNYDHIAELLGSIMHGYDYRSDAAVLRTSGNLEQLEEAGAALVEEETAPVPVDNDRIAATNELGRFEATVTDMIETAIVNMANADSNEKRTAIKQALYRAMMSTTELYLADR